MDKKKHIFILTGAGISQESGIQTFRAADGTWNRYKITDVATTDGFRRDPVLVHSFYNERRKQLLGVKPNAAHFALAELEQKWKQGCVFLVTQNVDDLHERAGTKRVHHLHGSLLKARCSRCQHIFVQTDDLSVETPCPKCSKIGQLRPDVVWFNEVPRQLGKVYHSLRKCSIYLAIGTSGVVHPAASFFVNAQGAGAKAIELNLAETEASPFFDDNVFGPATEVVPAYVKQLLDKQ